MWHFSDDDEEYKIKLVFLSISLVIFCESGSDDKMLFKKDGICGVENVLDGPQGP